MPAVPFRTLDARTPEQWRRWLARHHESESEIWLVFQKRETGKPSLPYEAAVNEALCYGWIDSLIKRLDEARYARQFTPRKADSRWSVLNRQRYGKLLASGKLTPAGLKRAPNARRVYAARPPLPSRVPGYIQAALRGHPAACDYFERLAPSHRRMYIGWIDSAKKQETKMRRLHEAVGLLAAGQKLGLK